MLSEEANLPRGTRQRDDVFLLTRAICRTGPSVRAGLWRKSKSAKQIPSVHFVLNLIAHILDFDIVPVHSERPEDRHLVGELIDQCRLQLCVVWGLPNVILAGRDRRCRFGRSRCAPVHAQG